MFDQLKSFFDLAEIGQSRSSITNPLQWMIVVLIAGLILVCLLPHAPSWLVIAFVICIVGVLFVFIYAYLYFMHKKPDVLRSESFHLSKMAIEHGLIGDDIHGLFKGEQTSEKRSIDARQLRGTEEHE